MLNRVARFVAHDASELVACAAFDIEHLTSLQPDETRMCEVEWNRKPGHALRREPLFGKPDVRAKPEAPAVECLVQRIDARLEPGPFYSKAKVLDAELKQSFGGPVSPRESSFRHGCCEYAARRRVARWRLEEDVS